MAEPRIQIRLLSVADTSGVQAMTAAVRTSTAAVNPWTTASRSAAVAQRQLAQETRGVEERLNRVTPELRDHAKAAADSAKKGLNFGEAMLQGSRGIQDLSVAGIPGVVNNLEGLASALGMTAAGAGGITLVAVAFDLLIRNWDKVQGAFGKPEEVKAFWSAMAPDDATQRRLDSFNTSLENQAANYERMAAAKKANVDASQKEAEIQKQLADLWKGVVPTPEERGDLPALPGMDTASPEMIKAVAEYQKAQADTQAKVGTFNALDQAVQQQQRRVQDINAVASFDQRRALANAADQAEISRLSAFENEGGPVPADVAAQLATLRQRVADRDRQMRASVANVPGLTDALTGDPEKDRASLQQTAQREREQLQALEAQRLAAAREAEVAARGQAGAEQAVAGQSRVQREQMAAAAFQAGGLPPAPGQFLGADIMGGLTQADAQGQEAARIAQQITALLQNLAAQRVQPLTDLSGGLQEFAASVSAEIGAVKGTVNALQQSVNNIRTNAQ